MVLASSQEQSPMDTSKSYVRVASVSCGILGCMNVAGNELHLGPIYDKCVGILTGMHKLGVDIVGMPGSRLPANWQPNSKSGCAAHCRWRGNSQHRCCHLVIWAVTDDCVRALLARAKWFILK